MRWHTYLALAALAYAIYFTGQELNKGNTMPEGTIAKQVYQGLPQGYPGLPYTPYMSTVTSFGFGQPQFDQYPAHPPESTPFVGTPK